MSSWLAGSRGRASLATFIDQAVVSASSFFSGVIVGRACSKEEFGLYNLGLGLVVFATGLHQSLISSPYTVFNPRLTGAGEATYLGSTLTHQLGLSTLAMLALALGAAVLAAGIGPEGLAPVLWALAAVMALITLREYARKLFFARLRMTSALLMDVCVAVVQIGSLLALDHLGLLTPARAFWVAGAACGAVAAAWLIEMRGAFTLRASDARRDLALNWSMGKWLLAGTLLFTAGTGLYPWLLTSFHGPAATGVLGACMGVTFLANPFFFGLRNILDPWAAHGFARGGRSEVRSVVAGAAAVALLAMGVFSTALWLFGGRVVALLYGAQYAGNDTIVRLVAVTSLVSVLGMPAYSGLLAMERSRVAFKSYLVAVVIMLTLGFWLVKSFGASGAAIGLLLSSVGSSAFRWLEFLRGTRATSAAPLRP
jgi:O-antigen/teichoic acid export membrane protein